MNKSFLISVTIIMLILLTACNHNEQEPDEAFEIGEVELEIAHLINKESSSLAYVWQQLLEEKGYTVTLTAVEKALFFEGIVNNKFDLGLNATLPHTDSFYIEEHPDHLQFPEEAIFYEGAETGLAVPTYMENVETIEDLLIYSAELGETIIGIEAGSSLMNKTENDVMPHYGLTNFTLVSSSEKSMISELEQAYENKEFIVMTLWRPHWLFHEYDLKFLEDADNQFNQAENLFYVKRDELESDHPHLMNWLNNSFIDESALNELLALGYELGDEKQAATEWIKNNRELIDRWFTP